MKLNDKEFGYSFSIQTNNIDKNEIKNIKNDINNLNAQIKESATKKYVDDNVAITKLKNTGTEYKLVWNEITNSGIYSLVGNWYYALGNKSESYLLISVEVDKSEPIMEVVIHGLGLAMLISTLDGSILYENHFATEDLVLKKNNTNEYEPIEDYNPATKKYVDAQSVKKLTSTNEAPIVINDLADGIYDFGNSSFVKMFNSDASVLTDNITGICVLYSVKGVNKRFLYVDYKLSTPTGTTYKYELNTSNSTYKTHKYNSLLLLGGTSSSILVIKDEPLLVTGMCVTICSGLKMLSTDDYTKTVSLGTGKKTLYMNSSTSGDLKTYHITIINPHNGIIKATFVYNTSTNTTISVDKQEYATKEDVVNKLPIKVLEGTLEDPIVCTDLEQGYYMLSNFKRSQTDGFTDNKRLVWINVANGGKQIFDLTTGHRTYWNIASASVVMEDYLVAMSQLDSMLPKNLSELVNDCDFTTKEYVDEKTSSSNYVTKDEFNNLNSQIRESKMIIKLESLQEPFKNIWETITETGIYYLKGTWKLTSSYSINDCILQVTQDSQFINYNSLFGYVTYNKSTGQLSSEDYVTTNMLNEFMLELPEMSFNPQGELVVTIGGTTKTFVPKQ